MNKQLPVLAISYLIIPVILVGCILSFAGNWSDGLRLAALSIPGMLFSFLAKYKKPFFLLAILWWILFLLDSLIRSVSWWLWDSDNDATFIIEAISNTNIRESFEFLHQHIFFLICSSLVFTIFFIFYFYLLFKLNIKSQLNSNITLRLIIIVLILTTLTAYFMKPSRKIHPFIYWPNYYNKIKDFSESIKSHKNIHQYWTGNAKKNLKLENSFVQKQTHIIVLTDSLTSFNFGLCGYDRNTTPELTKRSGELQVFCNTKAPAASTIPSLRSLFIEDSNIDSLASESFLGYAKAAGFKIFWLSNQNDNYISSLFGNYTDTKVFLNQRSGRSSNSLDENLIPSYKNALADKASRKLIILHLLGSHPNYEARYPLGYAKFNANTDDRVEKILKDNDRSYLIQLQRNYYDNSVLYQDYLVSYFFDELKKVKTDNFRSFTFLSDHGNEVGHQLNYAGHNPNTEAGYRVPLILWSDSISNKNKSINLHKEIYANELDNYLMNLMGITSKNKSTHNTPWLENSDKLRN